MSSHILDPIRAVVRRLRRRENPAPAPALFDGMSVPDHLVGKPFGIYDSDGRLVASVGVDGRTIIDRVDAKVGAMLG